MSNCDCISGHIVYKTEAVETVLMIYYRKQVDTADVIHNVAPHTIVPQVKYMLPWREPEPTESHHVHSALVVSSASSYPEIYKLTRNLGVHVVVVRISEFDINMIRESVGIPEIQL
jgi:hypothetical protein